MLTAWLLLLLRDGESYGRALFARLGERGVSLEDSLAYRTLRALDRDGAVRSRWTPSDAGPQRRSYRLTRAGRRRLTELAANITATLRLHEAFVREYERVHAEQGPADGDGIGSEEPREPSRQPTGDERAVHARRARSSESAAPADVTPAPPLGREELAAWLLLLLAGGPSYGYGLRRALDERHVQADPGSLYRVLRKLEREGSLASKWMSPAAGPRRRFYRLTDTGRRQLDDLAEGIRAARDGHAAFLRAYGQAAD